jgi:dihydrofolate reductase
VDSLQVARSRCAGEPLMVIGGGEIYAMTLPLASRLHLTHVDTEVADADAFFPALDPAAWEPGAREAHAADARHAFAFEFVDYRRRGAA